MGTQHTITYSNVYMGRYLNYIRLYFIVQHVKQGCRIAVVVEAQWMIVELLWVLVFVLKLYFANNNINVSKLSIYKQ